MKPLSKRAAALLGQYPGPVTIRYSKWLYLFMLACFAVATTVIAWLTWLSWPRVLQNTEAMVYLAALILILGAVLALTLISIAKGLPRLVLSTNGFAFEALLASYRPRWSEVDRFKARIIYVGLSDLSQPRGFWDKVNRFGSRGRRVLFAMFELHPSELAPLLTAWRERALSAGQADHGSSSVSQ